MKNAHIDRGLAARLAITALMAIAGLSSATLTLANEDVVTMRRIRHKAITVVEQIPIDAAQPTVEQYEAIWTLEEARSVASSDALLRIVLIRLEVEESKFGTTADGRDISLRENPYHDFPAVNALIAIGLTPAYKIVHGIHFDTYPEADEAKLKAYAFIIWRVLGKHAATYVKNEGATFRDARAQKRLERLIKLVEEAPMQLPPLKTPPKSEKKPDAKSVPRKGNKDKT